MKLVLYSPFHINKIEDIYMARYQLRFFNVVKKIFPNTETVFSIDKDATSKFDELIGDIDGHNIIELRQNKPTGIVDPTKKALLIARQLEATHFLRITMDTQVPQIDEFKEFINQYGDKDCLVGCKDVCSNIEKYLKELNIEMKEINYEFVQGNFIFGSMNNWNYYDIIPKTVKHYCDDSILSYLVEYNGVKPLLIKDFWKHNRTKNVLYLESLYA